MSKRVVQPDFLPMTRAEAAACGWDELDVIFVTGDAYVDHPAFAPALLGRMLVAKGFRVGVIARPQRAEELAALGRPRLFFAASPGCADSMVNNTTAQKRRRRTDAYAPGGCAGGRPDRALIVYCNMIRQTFGKKAAILGGGVEASLRRFAHYDFIADAIRRPILLDAPADALAYGMGERVLLEAARAMRSRVRRTAGAETSALLAQTARTIPGMVWRCAASEPPPEGGTALPEYEKIRADGRALVEAFNTERRFRATGVYQESAGHRVAANAPPAALSTEELDAVYASPFKRRAHPVYAEQIPALDQVQFSVTSHRGCFGGCAFCGIAAHQGKAVVSRSEKSILAEIYAFVQHPDYRGTVRDIGGATANMWTLGCNRPKECERPGCLTDGVCKDLRTNQDAYRRLLAKAREIPEVKHLFVSTGVRMDLALKCAPFIEDLAHYYTSGHLRVAPEHVTTQVLEIMRKPRNIVFENFLKQFRQASSRAGKEQYVAPYFIAAHPGSRLEDMIEVALFLKKEGMRVTQCQIFTPTPGTASTVMYATGIDPYTGKEVYVEKDMRRRRMQKALVLFHLPESAQLVQEALSICGRADIAHKLVCKKQ